MAKLTAEKVQAMKIADKPKFIAKADFTGDDVPSGYKTCANEKCGGLIRGPAKKTCPSCNAEQPTKGTAGDGKRKGKKGDNEIHALRFALEEGSIDKAMKAVAEYQADSVAEFVARCGGSAEATTLLQTVKAGLVAK